MASMSNKPEFQFWKKGKGKPCHVKKKKKKKDKTSWHIKNIHQRMFTSE